MGRKKHYLSVQRKNCDSCYFRHHLTRTCDYILKVGHSRPCSVSDCTCYIPERLCSEAASKYIFGYSLKLDGKKHAFIKTIIDGQECIFDIAPMMKGGHPLKLDRDSLTQYKQVLSSDCLNAAVPLAVNDIQE